MKLVLLLSHASQLWELLQAITTMSNLYKLFRGVDATQVEINPLGMTKDGKGMRCPHQRLEVCLSNLKTHGSWCK